MAFMPLQNSKFFACGGQYPLALLVNLSSVKNLGGNERATETKGKLASEASEPQNLEKIVSGRKSKTFWMWGYRNSK